MWRFMHEILLSVTKKYIEYLAEYQNIKKQLIILKILKVRYIL